MLIDGEYAERNRQAETLIEKYRSEAEFHQNSADEKEKLIQECHKQLKNFDSVNGLRDELMHALENENNFVKEQISLMMAKNKEIKSQFKAYRMKKRAVKKQQNNNVNLSNILSN